MTEKKSFSDDPKGQYYDLYHAGFYGFDRLEREFRADGWFYGRASDFALAKADLIRERPHNCLLTVMSGCYICGPMMALFLINDAALIVHGPVGCSSYLYSLFSLYWPKVMISTEMDEQDAILGGEPKLRRAIQEVLERYRPGMIGVIGTCTSSIIGDDLDGICTDLERESGTPIIPFHAAGFKHQVCNMGTDEAFNMIIDRMERRNDINRGSINFINFPAIVGHWKEFFEILPYLERLGIRINTHAPCLINFRELLEKFPQAELNVVRCTGMGLQSAEYAEKRLGIPYLRLPRPVSIQYTRDFILGIATYFGLQPEASVLIREEEERIAERLNRVRSKLKGRRVAITSGPGKNIALAQLMTELGMEVVYLAPVKVDPLYHELLQAWLKSTGQDPEFLSEVSVYETEAILSRLRPDLYLGIPVDRLSASRLGIPSIDMIAISYPQLAGFEGVVKTGEYLVDLLENRLLKDWGRYFEGQFPTFSSQEFLKVSPLALRPCQKKEGLER